MDAIQALLRLVAIVLAASLDPAPQSLDPSADVRMSLLGQHASVSDGHGLEGVARWQQSGDEVPSDLPDATDDATDGGEEEPLDADLEGIDDEEILDADLDEETLDAPFEEDEPLDAPLDEDLPPDDIVDLPTEEPAPVAGVPVTGQPVLVLPDTFGAGDTIVRNPTGGNTAEVPSDCKVLVQNGRAVVGSGCGAGSDDGPWWQGLVGTMPAPAAPASGAGPPAGFPFDDPPSSSPFGESFPFDDGGVVITGPAPADDDVDTVQVMQGADSSDEEDITVTDVRARPDNERAERRAFPELRPSEIDVVRRPGARTPRADRASELRVAQTSRADKPNKPKKAKAKLNPCQTARQVAKNPKSKQQLARARAKCRQYKKAQRQARTDSQHQVERRRN